MKHETLIINRPFKQAPIQIMTGGLLTGIAWLLLIYAFIPLVDLICELQNVPPLFSTYNITSSATWKSVGEHLPYWSLAAAVLIAALYGWACLQIFRFRNKRRLSIAKLVTTDEVAAHCGHAAGEIRTWAKSRRAVAHYDAGSELASVKLHLQSPFRANPQEGEPPGPEGNLATCPDAGTASAEREVMMLKLLKLYRSELIKQWSKVEAFETMLKEIAERNAVRNNERDVVLYAELKKRRQRQLQKIEKLKLKIAEARCTLEEHQRLRGIQLEPDMLSTQ